jgi:hypothetical protein
MSRIFNRVLSFRVEGEIYDTKETTPENIIKNYEWTFRDNDDDGTISVIGRSKDKRGRISKIVKLPKIHKWKTPDTEAFIKM